MLRNHLLFRFGGGGREGGGGGGGAVDVGGGVLGAVGWYVGGVVGGIGLVPLCGRTAVGGAVCVFPPGGAGGMSGTFCGGIDVSEAGVAGDGAVDEADSTGPAGAG